jgi:hypothetical protein
VPTRRHPRGAPGTQSTILLGQKIGRAEKLFVNWNEEPEYVRVRIGIFGPKGILIPVQLAEVDYERQTLVLK